MFDPHVIDKPEFKVPFTNIETYSNWSPTYPQIWDQESYLSNSLGQVLVPNRIILFYEHDASWDSRLVPIDCPDVY